MRDVQLLKVLADDTRLDIVLFLMSGKKNVTQIVNKIHKSQPNISLALKQLLTFEVLIQEKKGREIYYSVRKPNHVRALIESLEELMK